MERIVVACSGDRHLSIDHVGSDAAGPEIVALMLDFGDGAPLEAARDAALASGAVRAHVLDVREEYVRDYLLPALRAGVLADAPETGESILRHAIARRKLDEIARLERATPVAPSSTAAPDEPAPRAATATAAQIRLSFDQGTPIALNGIPMPAAELLDTLATIAREHGIGRDRVVSVLQTAHGSLVDAASTPEIRALGGTLRTEYARFLARDRWDSPARQALDAFFSKSQETVTGVVAMTLQNGGWAVVRVDAGGVRVQ